MSQRAASNEETTASKSPSQKRMKVEDAGPSNSRNVEQGVSNVTLEADITRYVHLNVGGVSYTSSIVTLTKEPKSMLGRMFLNGDVPIAKDDKGRIMIDRDGTLFRHVLNYLRNGELVLPEQFDEFELLKKEAKFYSIGSLITAINEICPKVDKVNFVSLAVGAERFVVRRSTLCRYKESKLYDMFHLPLDPASSGIDRPPVDHMGYFLIDRDGALFSHILNFLRNGFGRLVLPDDFGYYWQLREEAEFFRLQELSDYLRPYAFKQMKDVRRKREEVQELMDGCSLIEQVHGNHSDDGMGV